jgi:hypothetical protein
MNKDSKKIIQEKEINIRNRLREGLKNYNKINETTQNSDLSNNEITTSIELSNSVKTEEEKKINRALVKKKTDLLHKIRENCIQLNLYHNSRYHYYRIILFTIFRIPLILLSGLNSFVAVGTQKYLSQSDISLTNALLSLFCGVLTGIEILLNLQKRMETELDSYKKYYKLSVEIYKEIEIYEEDKDENMENLDKILNRVYNEYQSNVLSGNAITAYNRIYTDRFENLKDIGENEIKEQYTNTSNLITNLYYAINHPCSICGISTSRNMCLNLRNCCLNLRNCLSCKGCEPSNEKNRHIKDIIKDDKKDIENNA